MYTQGLGLKEKLAIVEDSFQIVTGSTNGSFTLIPDGNAEIIIPIKENLSFKCIGSVRSLNLLAGKGYFIMPRRRGAEISLSFRTRCLVIKLNPVYAKKIAERITEISNGVFDLDLSLAQVDELYSMVQAKDRFEMSDYLENLFDDISELYEYNTTILHAIDQIKESCGTISVKEIYSNLSVSKSKLEQHFNREIGLTPKEFCKIEKVNCFINAYKDDENLSLTELTYQCGYYDQSHLIKDFKYFLDTSPKKFFANKLRM